MFIMSDLRTIKTKAAVENAMMELIEIKGFSKIKMVDIAEKAMVNRNTIYLHYGTKEEIVMSIINRSYNENDFVFKGLKLMKSAGKKEAKLFLQTIIDNINKNVELYRILLTDPNLNGYVNTALKSIKEGTFRYLEDTIPNRIKLDYIFNGVYGVISRWVIYAVGTKEEVVDEIIDIFVSDIKKLTHKK